VEQGGEDSLDPDVLTFGAKEFGFSKFLVCLHGQQRWERIRSPASFFGSGFEFLGKTRFGMNGMMYRMFVKAWKRLAQPDSESKI